MADLSEVFVPGGMPSYTYQDRKELHLEDSLSNAIHRVRKFIAVAGPTKSGKTVLVRRVVPPTQGIWIEGAHIPSIDSFWRAILAGLGIASPTFHAQAKTLEESTEFDVTSGFKPAGIGSEMRAKELKRTGTTETRNHALQNSLAQSAVSALLGAKKTVVIDDFHYVSPDESPRVSWRLFGLSQAATMAA